MYKRIEIHCVSFEEIRLLVEELDSQGNAPYGNATHALDVMGCPNWVRIRPQRTGGVYVSTHANGPTSYPGFTSMSFREYMDALRYNDG